MSLLLKWKDEGKLDPLIFAKLQEFIDLLIQWNSRINLTGLHSRDTIEEALIEESILAFWAYPLSGKKVVDFGSGAGIPGLVWSIVDPTIALTSIEIRAKKISFQKEVVRRLDLSSEIVHGKFPEVVRDRHFDVVTTRAVRLDQSLLDRCLALLTSGGSILRFVSSEADPERDWRQIPLSKKSSLLVYTL